MLTPLCNRHSDGRFTPPADGWYHLVPRGTFPCPGLVRGQRPEVSQILDDRALESIENQFRAEKTRPNFPGLLIDFDHFSYDPARPSEAAGWLEELNRRPDGLWGRIKWSDKGEEAVSNGRYRFVSPTWLLRDCEPAESPAPAPSLVTHHSSLVTFLRPLRLDSLALTNSPNLRGMAPLSNRRDAASAGTLGRTDSSTQNQEIKTMKTVAHSLGLSPDAAEEAVLAEVSKLQHRVRQAEESLAPVKNRVAELESAHTALLAAQVESDLEIHKNRFPAVSRDQWKAALLQNRASTLGLLAGLPQSAAAPAEPAAKTRIHNRETAGDPGRRLAREAAAEANPDTPENRVQAAAIRNRATELRAANKKLTYDQAFKMAKNELATT